MIRIDIMEAETQFTKSAITQILFKHPDTQLGSVSHALMNFKEYRVLIVSGNVNLRFFGNKY